VAVRTEVDATNVVENRRVTATSRSKHANVLPEEILVHHIVRLIGHEQRVAARAEDHLDGNRKIERIRRDEIWVDEIAGERVKSHDTVGIRIRNQKQVEGTTAELSSRFAPRHIPIQSHIYILDPERLPRQAQLLVRTSISFRRSDFTVGATHHGERNNSADNPASNSHQHLPFSVHLPLRPPVARLSRPDDLPKLRSDSSSESREQKIRARALGF